MPAYFVACKLCVARFIGVCQLVVAVNKMDESTCQWSEERYREIARKTKTFFQKCGFVEGKNLCYVPISGLGGQNLKVGKLHSRVCRSFRSS